MQYHRSQQHFGVLNVPFEKIQCTICDKSNPDELSLLLPHLSNNDANESNILHFIRTARVSESASNEMRPRTKYLGMLTIEICVFHFGLQIPFSFAHNA